MQLAVPDALADRWARIPGNTRGALWIMMAALAFTGMTVSIKILGQTMGVWQMIALRSIAALIMLMPLMARGHFLMLRTNRPGLHIFRGMLGFTGITCMFLALTHLELALVTTLGFTRALFVIVLALLFLGEKIRWRRSLATATGFIGVIMCVQPGTEAFDPWTLIAITQAFVAAGVATTVKRLTRTEQPFTIVCYNYILMGGLAAVPALFNWQPVSWQDLAMIVAMGVFTTIGQTCMTYGLRAGEATAVVPFDYTRLLWAIIFGFLIFGELPGIWTLVGGTIIIGSTLYIAMREARLARERRAAARQETEDVTIEASGAGPRRG